MSPRQLLMIAVTLGLLSLLTIYVAMKRKTRHRWLIVIAVVIGLALLPISIMRGGSNSVWRYGLELLLLWWGPSIGILLLALLSRLDRRIVPSLTPPARLRCPARLRHRPTPGSAELNGLLRSPLVAVPESRRSVLSNLKDTSRIGVLSVRNGSPSVRMDEGPHMGFGLIDPADPLAPREGEERVTRVCDWYAWHLSMPEGSPPFEPYWPEDRRDEAVKECADFVEQWGERFEWNETQPPIKSARMTFPKRDRPATPAEAAAHAAIFSLGGEGAAVRVVPLEAFPAKAVWTTLDRYVVRYKAYDAETKTQKIVTRPDREGRVWQAEEVFEGGRWRRYYGFVGNHVVAKVPAEEIEIVDEKARAAP